MNNSASEYLDSSPGPLTNLFGNYANYYTGTTPQTSANGPGFTIGGLATNGIYSLYLYSCSGKWANNFNDFLVGGVQKNLTNSTDTSFVQNNNYVKFSGLTPASDGTISGTYWGGLGVDGNYNAILNGLQIVQTGTLPEPSTIVLVATGLLSLLAYAWRSAGSQQRPSPFGEG